MASWSATIRRYIDNEPKAVEKAVDVLAAEAFRRVVDKTPVDTGRARAGWEKDPAGAGFDRKVRIDNAVPYIGVLEHGSSKQAPLGMVALTVAELKDGG